MGIGCSVADRNRSLLITTKTWIVNPKIHGPCRRSAADLSSAADAPTYMSLGSHAKSGPRMRRSPRRATSYRRRNGSWALAVAHGRLRSHSLAPRQHLPRSKPERLERVLLRATIDSLTNLVNSDAAHAPTKSRTSHFRVHPWRPYHHIAAFPQSRWASAVMPMASDLGDSEIGSSSSGSQHATPPCSHSLAKPHKFLGTLSVHELGRLCRYLPPTISRSVGRSADGERPWRQSSSSGSQYASLLPLASILARTR
jgi:hypothetical protein